MTEEREGDEEQGQRTIMASEAQALALEVERVKKEAIRQAMLRRHGVSVVEDDSDICRFPSSSTTTPSSLPPLVLLEGVDVADPRLPPWLQTLLDSPKSTSPTERNARVRTRPAHAPGFGHGDGHNITYYPDHIPLPAGCHWLVSVVCLFLGILILMGLVTNSEGLTDILPGTVILIAFTLVPGLWCLRWGRKSQLKRKALFVEGEAFPGRWRQGYYTIGKDALVDYNETSGVWVFPVEHIESMYQRTEGGGGARTTSYHLVYRTVVADGTRTGSETKKILLEGQGDHLVYWWKHVVKEIPTWSQEQARKQQQQQQQQRARDKALQV